MTPPSSSYQRRHTVTKTLLSKYSHLQSGGFSAVDEIEFPFNISFPTQHFNSHSGSCKYQDLLWLTVLRCNTTRTGKSCTLHNFTVILYLQYTCFTTQVFIQRSQSNRKHSIFMKKIGFFTCRLRHGHTEANGLRNFKTLDFQIFLIPVNHPNPLNHPNHFTSSFKYQSSPSHSHEQCAFNDF